MTDRVLLGEIAESQTGPFGSQLHEEDYVEEGTPIVTVEHLGELGFTKQNLPLVSDEDVKRLNKFTLQEGDIVFSRVGSIDRNTYVTKDENGWMFSGRCIRVRCDKAKVNPLYLSYYFRLEHFKRMMLNVSVGATMPSLNTAIMDTLPIDMVERSEQNRIAEFLVLIDDKICNNNNISSNLEAMAKLLYDYWFVQFDFPNENGKPYKSSGGKMIWNDELKREIPAGWEVRPLKNVLKLLKDGTHNPPKRVAKGIPLLTGTMFGERFLDYSQATFVTEKDYQSIHSQYAPEERDIVLTKIGTLGNANYLRENDVPIAIHCNSALLRFPESMSGMYALIYCKSEEFQKRLRAAKGQSVQEFCSLDSIGSVLMILPDARTVTLYQLKTEPILKEMENVSKENQQLASLRDFLLPMLMNGQVKVG